MATIVFNSENHTYTDIETGKVLISTTQLLKKHHLSPNYEGVNQELLNNRAEHGTFVHKELEDYAKTGELGITDEFEMFYDYKQKHPFKILESERQVHNDIVAGTIDSVIEINGDIFLVDYKTTTNKNEDIVSRQLSCYKALQTKYLKIAGLLLFHFAPNGLEVILLKEKPPVEVEKLFECERKGELYRQELGLAENDLTLITTVEDSIAKLNDQLAFLLDTKAKLNEKLIEAMEQNNVKKFENDRIVITYKAPYKKKALDTKLLKKENAELCKKYEKESEVKASVLIRLKNE